VRWGALQCNAMLWCGVRWGALLAMLCCGVRWGALLAMLCYAMLCYAVAWCDVLCCAMLYYDVLRGAVLLHCLSDLVIASYDIKS
jgi:hypothetical protein